jgi:hypothetical protein
LKIINIYRSNLTSTTANQNQSLVEEKKEENRQNQQQNPAPKHQQQQHDRNREFLLKLTLPTAIENANHSQDLNSLSLLEQGIKIIKFLFLRTY